MKPNLNPSTVSEPAAVLNYFTQTPILRQIGHRRLAKLLNPFDAELKAARCVLPAPDPQNDDYFADLANALSIAERLPGRLRQTLLTIELAASPENDKPAVGFFRVVDQHQPTLLLDEVDAYLTHSEELCGLLNAGHKCLRPVTAAYVSWNGLTLQKLNVSGLLYGITAANPSSPSHRRWTGYLTTP